VNVIETSGLGKSYGRVPALHDCTLTVPAGRSAALVGPNGAGKSTLMNMLVGLTIPTAGSATVLGGQPSGSAAALDGTGFVAQDAPVYRSLSCADMLHLTSNLNRRFLGDEPGAVQGGRRPGRLAAEHGGRPCGRDGQADQHVHQR